MIALPPKRRVLLWVLLSALAAALGLEELYAERLDEVVELLAYHFGGGGENERGHGGSLLRGRRVGTGRDGGLDVGLTGQAADLDGYKWRAHGSASYPGTCVGNPHSGP